MTNNMFKFFTGSMQFRRALIVGWVSALVACADPAGIHPQARMLDAAALGLQATQTASHEGLVDAQWWRQFGDDTLNRLVEQALQNNPSLKVAQARLAMAQAGADLSQSALMPQLGARLDLTHQRYTANGAVPPPLAGSIRDSGTLQAAASWELDFFGKNQAALQAALGRVKASEADVQAARVLLATQVARTYFQLARWQALRQVLGQLLRDARSMLALQQQRLDAGLDTRLELRQNDVRVTDLQQQLALLDEQASLTRHALTALLGQAVTAENIEPIALQAIQRPTLSAVLPAEVLGQRPDMVAARWRVQAAAAGTDSAKAQFYPNVNLAAFAGFSSIGLNQLLNAGSQQWGITPAISLPVFDAGRLRAGLRGSAAELDAAVESYNLTLIGAVREAADQWSSVRAIESQQVQQQASARAVLDIYETVERRFQTGLTGRMNVLRAQSDVLAQRRLQIDLTARWLDARVNLIHALGGGYSETHLPKQP